MKARIILLAVILTIIFPFYGFSFGHKEKPEINVQTTGPQYLSPNGDGVMDTATFTFTVKLKIKSKEGYVPSYGIQVTDSAGTLIVEEIKKDKSDMNFFEAFFAGYRQFDLTKDVTWDGKDGKGNIAPDGTYNTMLWVKDDAGNRTEQLLEKFILDTKPPEASITLPYNFFSPNNDGNQDVLAIAQSGAVESAWKGMIQDESGKTVNSRSWNEAALAEFNWDGKFDDGTNAPDGKYIYVLEGTDIAGNKASFKSDTIVLDTKETPVSVSVSSPAFSPNGDEKQDTVNILLAVDNSEGMVSWKVAITDNEGNAKKEFTGDAAALTGEILFDGKDAGGNVLPEGEYQAVFEVTYIQGNKPSVSAPIAIDLTAPRFEVVIENPYFSPNGDGYGDVVLIKVEADEPITAEGNVLDLDGNEIRKISIEETPVEEEAPPEEEIMAGEGSPFDASAPAGGEEAAGGEEKAAAEISWDGADEEGKTMPEAVYSLSLYIQDQAGNFGMFTGGEIHIDFTPPETYLSLNTVLFSPNGDGQKDTVNIEINTNEPVTGNCVIKDSEGNEVQVISVFADITHVEWNGLNKEGATVPDGTYTIEGVLSDLAGNSAATNQLVVAADTRATQLTVTAPSGFSPNGDSIDDTLVMAINAETMDGISAWTLDIEKSSGGVSKSFSGQEVLPPSLTWDGIGQNNQISEGKYTAKLKVEYLKGNVAEAVSNTINLDVTPPRLGLDVKSDKASGEEESIEEEVFITLNVEDESEIKEWNLDIVNYEGEIIRTYTGEGNPEDEIAWNATANNKKPVPAEDMYTVVISARDVFGNTNTYKQKLPLDLLIARIGDKYYLIVPNIIFGAYQYKLDSAGKTIYKRNMDSLKKAAEIYNKYSKYKVGLEAHALDIYLDKGEAAREKEEKRLVPLTKNRAEEVQKAMEKLGIAKERFELSWFGGTDPIVSVSDKKIYWKNRRVEFLLIKSEDASSSDDSSSSDDESDDDTADDASADGNVSGDTTTDDATTDDGSADDVSTDDSSADGAAPDENN